MKVYVPDTVVTHRALAALLWQSLEMKKIMIVIQGVSIKKGPRNQFPRGSRIFSGHRSNSSESWLVPKYQNTEGGPAGTVVLYPSLMSILNIEIT